MSAYPMAASRSDDDLNTCCDFSKRSIVTVCLGFTSYEPADDETIIGNQVQRIMEIVYDVAGKRIGFAPNGCN
ncbi:hypothetical protein ACOSP7_006588 [Xanthoceras sorbifolium]